MYRRGESIYHAELNGRTGGDEWQLSHVAALVKPAQAVFAQGMSLKDMFEALPRRPLERAYVTDGAELVGWLDLRGLLLALREGKVDGAATVASVVRPANLVLTADMPLGAALDVFLRARANVLPVVS